MNEVIQLTIDAFSPETLPMSRLADYLKSFALMIGSEENVHFSKIKREVLFCLQVLNPQPSQKLKPGLRLSLTVLLLSRR